MDFSITTATLDDVSALAKLHIEVEQETYARILPGYIDNVSGIVGREDIWRLALSDFSRHGHILIVKDNKEVMVGFLSAVLFGNNSAASLGAIFLLEKYKRLGLGTQLFARYAKKLEAVGTSRLHCEMPSSCKSARAFFAWTGGVESHGDIFLSSQGIIQMTKVTWNNVSQLVKYLDLLD